MKFSHFYWIFPTLALALGAGITACGGPSPVPMVGSAQAPAAEGSVTVQATENGNTRITLDVKHLAFPERVSPAAKVYVVWVLPPGGPPQNVGALRVNADLTGRLVTVTAFPSFEVMVTAEELPTGTLPAGPQVLRAAVAQ